MPDCDSPTRMNADFDAELYFKIIEEDALDMADLVEMNAGPMISGCCCCCCCFA